MQIPALSRVFSLHFLWGAFFQQSRSSGNVRFCLQKQNVISTQKSPNPFLNIRSIRIKVQLLIYKFAWKILRFFFLFCFCSLVKVASNAWRFIKNRPMVFSWRHESLKECKQNDRQDDRLKKGGDRLENGRKEGRRAWQRRRKCEWGQTDRKNHQRDNRH